MFEKHKKNNTNLLNFSLIQWHNLPTFTAQWILLSSNMQTPLLCKLSAWPPQREPSTHYYNACSLTVCGLSPQLPEPSTERNSFKLSVDSLLAPHWPDSHAQTHTHCPHCTVLLQQYPNRMPDKSWGPQRHSRVWLAAWHRGLGAADNASMAEKEKQDSNMFECFLPN